VARKAFASQGDMAEKKISFTEVGRDLWAFTAEGDPNTGVIIGDDSVMIVDAQATPRLAGKVIEKIRSVTDKPVKYVVLIITRCACSAPRPTARPRS
jgi:glyoxylase-like metal-dependent hydrolase (beta-lactamase superfamily II)